jgi:hypothetical protein
MTHKLIFCTMAVALAITSPAWSQTSSTGTTAAGTPGLSSGSSSSSFGSSAFGNPNFGSTSSALSAQDFGGAGSGNLLRGALSQQGLIAATTTSALTMGMGGMGGMGRGGMQGMQGMNNQNNQNNPRAQLKFATSLGFKLPPSKVAARATLFEGRLKRLPGLASGKNVIVTVQGTMAILEGTVESEHERSIIERLAKMEAGIYSVDNQLVVASDTSNLETLPPPLK